MKFNKILALILTLAMMISAMSTVVLASEENVESTAIANAYVSQDTVVSGWTTIWGQLKISGTENFYVEIYSDDTYMGKTSLVDDEKVILNGNDNQVTWHAFLAGSDSWWNTEWAVEPDSTLAPTDVKYYVDDKLIGTGVVKMSSPDDLKPVVWEELRGVKLVVAKIGQKTYSSLTDALTAAKAAGSEEVEITIIADGDLVSATNAMKGFKKITFNGTGEEVLNFVLPEHSTPDLSGVSLEFNSIVLQEDNNIYNGFDNCVDIVYNNCTIKGVYFAEDVVNLIFNSCTFEQDNPNSYNIWTYAAKNVQFNDCTFNCAGKSVLIYNEGAANTKATVDNCTFTASKPANDGKAAIEIDTSKANYYVDVKDSTAVGFDKGSVSGSNLWNQKKGESGTVILDGKVVASKVTVNLVRVDNTNVYDIVLSTNEKTPINEFVAAQFTVDNKSYTTGEPGSMKYIVTGNGDLGISYVENADKPEVLGFHISEHQEDRNISGSTIKVGQIEFVGNGTIDLTFTDGIVTATKYGSNDEIYYTTDGGEAASLVIGTKADGSYSNVVKTSLNVNLDFIHDTTTGNTAAYNGMTITVTGPLGYKKVGKIGTVADDADVVADVVNNKATLTFEDVVVGYRYTVKLEAPGYRTYTYATTIEKENPALRFWNDAKRGTDIDPKISIEDGKTETDVTFLVGDIAMDYIVDKYDLAAVTSYYGTYGVTNGNLIKYDLNRDGNIDILDIGYVIHGLGY